MSLLEKLSIRPESDTENGPEIEPVFAQDPEPGERPSRAKKASGRAATKPPAARRPAVSTAKMAKEVSEDLATMLEVGATMWGLTDDCCAPVLEQQAKPIADALVGILSRNPRLLAQLANSSIAVMGVQSIALFNALAPVGKAVYRNHISNAVDDDQEGAHDATGAVHLGNFPAFSGRPRSVPA